MRILLGMSGGLDSTYCAALLQNAGHTVEGALLIFGPHTETGSAQLSCKELGIPLHIIDCSEDFEKYVISDFIENYKNGRTPNPCTVCNRFVKMEYLYRACIEGGYDGYATGHYARVERDPVSGRYFVARAQDPRKDQSYMLWKMTQKQLSGLITPLSSVLKDSVRESALALGLSASGSKESQDICFIPRGESYIDFIESRIGSLPEGEYIDKDQRVIGRHKGILRYTVGQRKGLGASFGKHMFITDISAKDNRITLRPAEETFAAGIEVGSLNFQRLEGADGEYDLQLKIRYAAAPVPCRVRIEGDRAYVSFSQGIRTPAPGQSAVFYSGDALMLGGVIEKTHY